VQNKPNLEKRPNEVNLCVYNGLQKYGPFGRPKSKPKQTQTKPIRPPFFARQRHPKPKQTQTNPKQSQFIAAQPEEI
jgi:hypothetical protein